VIDAGILALVSGALLAWVLVSARLRRADVTAPMTFVALGLLADGIDLIEVTATSDLGRVLAETTLVMVLFSDAARVDLRRLRDDAAFPIRLLAVGLPLTILAGWGLAAALFPGVDVWAAVLLAACLAPTDAGLGSAIVSDPVVPARIRRTLNVESGLNDGIVAPLVSFAIASLAATETHDEALVSAAAKELLTGTAVGVACGVVGGWLLLNAVQRGLADRALLPIASLALAGLTYTAALSVHGNGFVAAFVGGLLFGPALRTLRRIDPSPAGAVESSSVEPDSRPTGVATGGTDDDGVDDGGGTEATGDGADPVADPLVLTELAGQLLGCIVWFLFGAVLLGHAFIELEAATLAYAVLSLTVVRMGPVALSLVGMKLGRPSLAFVGWFGPRGLASLVFGLLASRELGATGDPLLDAIALTVFLSVVAHGASAAPLARRYGRWARTQHAATPEQLVVAELPTRRRFGSVENRTPAR